MVKCLLEHGANKNLQTYAGVSALLISSQNGHTDTVKILLKWCAQVNLTTDKGMSALIAASWTGQTQVVKLLLECTDIQVDLQKKPLGASALRIASQEGHIDIAKLLVDNGAQVNLEDGEFGGSGLMGASENGHAEMANFLIAHGAQVNLQSHEGKSALNAACIKGHVEVIKILLGHGAEVDTEPHSPLLVAIAQGHAKIVNILLDHGARVNQRTNLSALLAVNYKGKPSAKVTEVLIDHGYQIEQGVIEVAERQIHNSQPKLADAFKELVPLAADWQNIGVLLKLSEGELQKIRHDYPFRALDSLREMLRAWLKTIKPSPTWDALAEAVEIINKEKGDQIRNKYCIL